MLNLSESPHPNLLFFTKGLDLIFPCGWPWRRRRKRVEPIWTLEVVASLVPSVGWWLGVRQTTGSCVLAGVDINTLRPRQNGRHYFTDDTLIFLNELHIKFHWNLFLRVYLTIFHHWFRQWLGAFQAPSHYLNQWWQLYWGIYVSLGLNKFIFSYC